MLPRAYALRRVLTHTVRHSPVQPPIPSRAVLSCLRRGAHLRQYSDQTKAPEVPSKPRGFLGRLFAPDESGENSILRMLGYYSAESKAIGVGNALYTQAKKQAMLYTSTKFGDGPSFAHRYEILSIHVYITLRRLRKEKGTTYERDIKTVMQCIFDVFWTDVRMGMLMKEQGMTLIKSATWIKECEQRFFGMAVAFDDAWESEDDMKEVIARNITCLEGDAELVHRLWLYIRSQRDHLDEKTIEQVWDGVECWDDITNNLQSL